MIWTAQSLSDLATGYWPAAAVMAAVELDLFDALARGPADAAMVAATVRAEASRVESLLDALTAIGLLTKTEFRYDLAADAKPLLLRSSPTCLLDALTYNGDLYRQWAHLAGVIRGDAPPSGGRSQLGDDPAATRRFVLGMDAKARAFAPMIADRLDLHGVTTLLDVGAGPGTLSRELAERFASLRVTLLDLAPVLEVARDVCATSPVTARLAFHPADYRLDPLPGPFDAVLYAGALHQETSQSATTLFASIRAALRPGGRVYVIDLMLDDTRTSPAFSAMFQLNMLLLRPESRVFSINETRTALLAAGIGAGRVLAVAQTPYVIVEGTAL